jgi:hypothetical protein
MFNVKTISTVRSRTDYLCCPCNKLSSRVTIPSRLPKPVNENRTARDRLSALRKQIRFYRPYWKAHTVKRISTSRPQPGCHWSNSPWPKKIKLFLARESLVSDIPAWDVKIENLFLQCSEKSDVLNRIFCSKSPLYTVCTQTSIPPFQSQLQDKLSSRDPC